MSVFVYSKPNMEFRPLINIFNMAATRDCWQGNHGDKKGVISQNIHLKQSWVTDYLDSFYLIV